MSADHLAPTNILSDGVGTPSFEETIQSFHELAEESRQSLLSYSKIDEKNQSKSNNQHGQQQHDQINLGPDTILEFHNQIELLHETCRLAATSRFDNSDHLEDVRDAILENCKYKLRVLIIQIVEYFVTNSGTSAVVPDDEEEAGSAVIQPAIARWFEIAVRLSDDSRDKSLWMEKYSEYQTRVIRQRAKPSVASLARHRRAKSKINSKSNLMESDLVSDLVSDSSRVYGTVVTVILGEASKLIQPLAGWRDSLGMDDILRSMCEGAVEGLYNESVKMACVILKWFQTDHHLKEWIDNMKMKGHDHEQKGTLNISSSSIDDVSRLDAMLDELAFLCQVSSRYCQFISNIDMNMNSNAGTCQLELLLSELSGQYATLEDHLLQISLRRALTVASPVEIYDGIFVPSVVEDAYFLSKQCVERCSSTMEQSAILTVLSRVVDMWGTHHDHNHHQGVYNGLFQRKGNDVHTIIMKKEQQELSEGNNTTDNGIKQSTSSGGFAMALLDAIDDDHSHQHPTSLEPPTSHRTESTKEELSSILCTLNGMASASSACHTLAHLLNSIMEDTITHHHSPDDNDNILTKMLPLWMEELESHSKGYTSLLYKHSITLVEDYCHHFLSTIFHILSHTDYNCNSDSYRTNIHNHELLVAPIRTNPILTSIQGNKCDYIVVMELTRVIAEKFCDLIVSQILLTDNKKMFNDWGSILFAKQVRWIQDVFCDLVLNVERQGPVTTDQQQPMGNKDVGNMKKINNPTTIILTQFQKVNTAVDILQLEKPSDWASYQYSYQGVDSGGGRVEAAKEASTSHQGKFTKQEVFKIMSLRVDFIKDAVRIACDYDHDEVI